MRDVPLWSAPNATKPIRATVTIPGSKSLTNRALILAAASTHPVTIHAPLRSRDTDLMAEALRALGVVIEPRTYSWHIVGEPLRAPAHVDCGLAGTIMRFLPPFAALANGPVEFDGDPAARNRPMGTLLEALRKLGATVIGSRLPFTLLGKGKLPGGTVQINASSSSQFVSGLLLSAARYEEGVTMRHVGRRLPSAPHIEMTIAMAREAGVTIDNSVGHVWRVEPGPIQAPDWHIEPDLSNAAPFLAAGLITGGEVTVADWPQLTHQPGDALRKLFAQFGAEVTRSETGLTVQGGGTITGIDVDLGDVGELTPVIAAVAAVANSTSHLRGIGHLRGHETDRLAALRTELSALGAGVAETDDGLIIEPRPLRGGTFASYDDHRMAQAGALLGLVVPNIKVENIATTGKTMPDFPERWLALLQS